MLKKVLLAIVGILVLLVVIAFLLPSHVRVERSIVINEPPSKVFNEVNNLRKWSAWDPWQKQDPNIKNNFSGPESGVGAKNEWTSENKNVGNGSQVFTESVPNEKIRAALNFGPGRDAKGTFDFSPEGEGTKAVWGMEMETGMNPIARYMGLMMDKWVGAEFETGLKNLKAHVEALPDEAPPVADTQAVDESTQPATN